MFHDIPPRILSRMLALEAMDAGERQGQGEQPAPVNQSDLQHLRRLRQITPDTGRFIAMLASGTPAGQIIELGTSGGYSTLWLALASLETGRKVMTFEIDQYKANLARETFRLAGVEDAVSLVEGDARRYLADFRKVSFCFLDLEKELYRECYEGVVPNLVKGGLLVADNAISHKDQLEDFLKRCLTDERVDALVVPVGKGELVCRRR